MCISFKPSSPIDNPLYGKLLLISFFQSPPPYPFPPLLTTFIVKQHYVSFISNTSISKAGSRFYSKQQKSQVSERLKVEDTG